MTASQFITLNTFGNWNQTLYSWPESTFDCASTFVKAAFEMLGQNEFFCFRGDRSICLWDPTEMCEANLFPRGNTFVSVKNQRIINAKWSRKLKNT